MRLKSVFWKIEDWAWSSRCRYNLWLHGPYGLAKAVEKMPFRFLVKYLRKYGASIGENCRLERGLNLHRPLGAKPFENLVIGNGVYLGHDTLIDLSRKVEIKDKAIFASRCQIWTHASYYGQSDPEQFEYGENYGPVIVEEGAIIYSNVVIGHGTRIGRQARVGACSLVIKDVPSGQFVGGVPADNLKTAS
jgi:acetyltransferase-like isoleucine patch superfamily enzyme